MTNNAILRQVRFALKINDKSMIELFSLSGFTITSEELTDLLKKESEEGYSECSNRLLNSFLDALILTRRGPSDNKKESSEAQLNIRSNNEILKKLRIALNFKENDMLDTFSAGNFKVSKSELSAFFRSRDHRNYKPLGDQMLRYFLRGLCRSQSRF